MDSMTHKQLRALQDLLLKFKYHADDVTEEDVNKLRMLVGVEKPYTARFADPDTLYEKAMVIYGTYVYQGTYDPFRKDDPLVRPKNSSSVLRHRESGSSVLRAPEHGSSIRSGRMNTHPPTSIRPTLSRQCSPASRIGLRVDQRSYNQKRNE